MISRSDVAGFTLTEMLVVLAIMALVSGRAVQQDWLSPLAANRLTATAQRLASDLRRARLDAMASGAAAGVAIDVPGHRYRRWPAGTEQALADGIDIRVSVGADQRSPPTGAVNLVFAPDGGSSGADIMLSQPPKVARVRLDWLTGRVDVDE
jgi:general secretion pathway protein H